MKRLVPDMTRAEYDALAFDNYSSLKWIASSPALYRWKKDHPEDDSDTDSRKFGRAGHLAILEPERFASQVAMWPGGVRNGKKWEAFLAEHPGREILTPSEAERLEAIRSSVAACDFAQPFLTGGRSEVTVLWDTEVVPGFAVPCKGRLDYEAPSALVDLKLTRDASPDGFGRQAYDLGYYGQAAFYSDGYEAATGKRLPFFFVAVENVPPFAVAVYEVTPQQMALGRDNYRRLISILSLCRIENEWPAYTRQPVPLAMPRWAEKQAEELLQAENLEQLEAANG